jgi:hypothetical protein
VAGGFGDREVVGADGLEPPTFSRTLAEEIYRVLH